MADVKDVRDVIAEETGKPYSQNKSMIDRRIGLALDDINPVVQWNFAIKSFSKDIEANKNSVSVATDMIFKPVYCKVTILGDTWPLDYILLSDFERMTAEMDTTTNSAPTLYSVGGNKLFVGPGLLTSSAVVAGKYQRKLTTNDIPYLPASLVIDRVLMGMLKSGTPAAIAAWSGWKLGQKTIRETYKVTAEKRSSRPLDPQIVANQLYMRGIRRSSFGKTSHNFTD